MTKDIVTLVGGFLTALLLFLGAVGIQLDWFNQSSIDAFVVLLGAGAALAINVYAVWKNSYVSKKAQLQKEELEKRDLL